MNAPKGAGAPKGAAARKGADSRKDAGARKGAGPGVRGLGIDLVDVVRFAQIIRRRGRRFLERVFTPAERAQGKGHPRAAEHFASRFAVKEAVFKALGTGLVKGLGWEQIEVRSLPSGKPEVRLSGACRKRFRALGATRVHVSLSHTESHTVAIVMFD